MISEKIEQAFNDQINAEVHSAYLYWSMVAYFESANLPGFAAWMRAQGQEEMIHASKFFSTVNERGGRVALQPIEGPATEWESPLAAFEAAYAHEQYITGRINDLVQLARQENDNAAQIFLQWFVTEQVEEEDSVNKVVQQLKLVGSNSGGLFMLDRELGQRVFTPPPAEGE